MTAPTSLRRPPALRPGDRVAVLTASSPVPAGPLEFGLRLLRDAGLEPVVHRSAREPGTLRPYLAGTDALRAADLTDALLDPSIAGIVFARGGSGAARTLAALEWSRFDGLAPKVLAGYSDVTAVHEAVARCLGWASVHSTVVASDNGTAAWSMSTLLEVLLTPERASECRFPDPTVIVGGRARGVTLGGNVCVLTASLGTPTSRPAAGGLLLVEEESEDPYRLDRMLTHLQRTGYLDDVAGVVCGRFHGCGPDDLVADVLAERLGTLGVPMITGADIGHGGANRAFPLGVAAELDADAGVVRFLDPPLIPRD
ncbi:muramoyltetrapeptide carboxypeptidase [Jatrophihabitans endophyticus]|uniref:Muramoyltetrapeptide carboxypeptidase n=1 Tax=Jatrophihabitans endophyticus TaxID=1206085 RepID=A0A1M5P596_9ACTN|nr:LD-carboxypeptidase [Jatrophihabitans endophyticus]SHG96589.1 muramoyltetrapeptide carboxypeptidase [Jatrophihabitans endophyticus]